MSAHVLDARHIALLGNPNCGKTALFNLLTGSRQKVANYAGVTVERKEGLLTLPSGRQVRVLDLPGAYSLNATSADETVTRDVVQGRRAGEAPPDLLVCVTDATNLRLTLRIVIEARRLGRPLLVALNLADVARKRGLHIDRARLEQELGVPVVETVAVRTGGAEDLVASIERWLAAAPETVAPPAAGPGTRLDAEPPHGPVGQAAIDAVMRDHREVHRLLDVAVREPVSDTRLEDALDKVLLHPAWGFAVLAAVLFLVFQAVFSWAQWPMDRIKESMDAGGTLLAAHMDPGLLRSLIVDGVIAGAGSVLVFLPQILILFFFILVLEDSGYLPRAAFLLDRVMASVGLTGRSFIPLLSSFACAIPGIMATRTIADPRDRLATILIAPLMTCSARLPVYALLIGAFIPARRLAPGVNLQGLVLFGLYFGGIVSAMLVAWVLQLLGRRSGAQHHTLMLELPAYRWPNLRNLGIGLLERARIFMGRVGTIILALMIVLWFLSSFPGPPEGATAAPITYSLAGRLGHLLEYVFAPIGFNWQIAIALVPGLAAREVAVGALGTVYALSVTGDAVAQQLSPLIARDWSLATACALLAWYVFAPQCIATLSVTRRETGGWRYPAIMAAYLFAMAYVAAGITYYVVRAFGG
ncbi:MAG TPA: ferrous iron transport protein B [Burkholderiaceae bacterium]|nr:ferrous iron transport protein B [Burkholderiaceae bacterium]